MGKAYGYVRASSTDQHEDRQLIAMAERGIPQSRLYMDKQSGKDFDRPRYRALMKKLRPGDQLCVTSIDRLGRNYEEIQEQWRILPREKKVDILVFYMPLLATRRDKDFVSDILLLASLRNRLKKNMEHGRVQPDSKKRSADCYSLCQEEVFSGISPFRQSAFSQFGKRLTFFSEETP